jgi:hypothetical protein
MTECKQCHATGYHKMDCSIGRVFTTTFRIREPLEYPRTVCLATRSQTLKTSAGNELKMLKIARSMLAEDRLFEVNDLGQLYPIIEGTVLLSCEVRG